MQSIGYSRFAAMPRGQAGLVVAALAVAWSALLYVAFTRETVPNHPPSETPEVTDSDLYGWVVERVKAGQNYYEALDELFHALDYPVRSLFNYRTPTYAWFFAALPSSGWCRGVGAGLLLLASIMCYGALRPEAGLARSLTAVLLMVGSLSWLLFDRTYLYTEAWVGALIAVSVAAYARDWRGVAVAAGLLALFFRELAFPYCGVAAALALLQRRRDEAVAWIVGFGLYGLFFAWHAAQVLPRVHTADRGVSVAMWLSAGGLKSLLAMARTNFFLLPAPSWAAAVILPLGLLGLAGWRSEWSKRAALTSAAYMALFCVVGNLDNFYWGLLYTQLLALGLPLAPQALGDLPRSLVRSDTSARTKDESQGTGFDSRYDLPCGDPCYQTQPRNEA
jgi:hypothetical protein